MACQQNADGSSTGDLPVAQAGFTPPFFTLTDLGPGDNGNPEWAKYGRIRKKGGIHDPYPDKNYGYGMLGDPKGFGTVPTDY